ncbi:hypothetical protein PA10_00264 [Pseudomonas phage pPa_SNUABM_DT01]|nr:hypothetical protein PA10_00264 [Pseudomonas phage pPa_SNUABM_DT01]
MSASASLNALAQSSSRYLALLRDIILKGIPQVFTPSGRLTTGPLKEWYGTVTSVNGVWTANVQNAGFVQILHVDPQAVYNDTAYNQQVTASINSVSLTSISGRVIRDGGKAGPNCSVMVKVTGR